jgi:hypothetical protein
MDQRMAEEWFTLREDLLEQERFVENMRREREAEVTHIERMLPSSIMRGI